MAAHVDAIIGELAHTKAGAEKALSMFGEADRLIQSSIDTAARGGFAAMAANLVAAQQQLRQLQAVLHNTCSEVGQALAPVAKAPKEIDAGQVLTLLGPLTGQVDKIRGGLAQAAGQVPAVAQRVAASANQNPAVGILTGAQQQFLAPTVHRVTNLARTISAALAEAKTAQAGK